MSKIYLQLAKQEEALYIHENRFSLRRGELMIELLTLDADLLSRVMYQINDTLSHGKQMDLTALILRYQSIAAMFPLSWQRKLFIQMPVEAQLHLANTEFEKVAFSENEQAEVQQGVKSFKFRKTPEYIQRDVAIRTAGNVAFSWRLWMAFLTDPLPPQEESLQFVRDIEPALVAIGLNHFQAALSFLVEMQKLRSILEESLNQREGPPSKQGELLNTESSLLNAAEINRIVRGAGFSKLIPCDTLSQMISLEFSALMASRHLPKKCRLCGHYFSPNSSRAQYCTRKNAAYGGTTCNEVGPTIDYRSAVNSDPVLSVYEKNYKTYHKWVEAAKRKLSTDEESFSGTSEKNALPISRELNSTFNQWCAMARNAREDYLHNRQTAEQAIQKITLPKIENRSPLYASAVQDERKRRGLL